MSKPIIIYNRKDFQISIIINFFRKLFTDILIIDQYNIYDTNDLKNLDIEIVKLKEENTDIRLLFLVNITDNEIFEFLDYKIYHNFRSNLIFFNVKNDSTVIDSLKKFNNSVTSTTVFGWLVGEKDSERNLIDEPKIMDVFLSWLVLLDSGALSFRNGQDIFYAQQNKRNENNHLYVLKSKVIVNDSLIDMLKSIHFHLQKLLEKFSEYKKILEYYDYQNPFVSEGLNEEKIEFNPPYIPSLNTIGKFKNIEEFEEKLGNILSEYEKKYVAPIEFTYSQNKSTYFKNKYEETRKKGLESFSNNIKINFLGKDKFNFSLITNYIKNTISNLKERIKQLFILEDSDLISSILIAVEVLVKNILRLRKDIENWKSKRKKKEYAIYAFITFIILLTTVVFILYYSLSMKFNLNLFAIELILSIILSSAFWVWKYVTGLKTLEQKLKREIKFLNNKIKKCIGEYIDNLPLRISKFLAKHWEKKLFSQFLVELKNLGNGLLNIKKEYYNFYENISLILKDRKDEKNVKKVDQEEVHNHLFNDIINSYLNNEICNSVIFQGKLMQKLFLVLNHQNKINDFETKNYSTDKFRKQAYPIDINYLIDLDNGKTSPSTSGDFIIKPKEFGLQNAGFDETINIDTNIALLFGEYYPVEL